MKILKLCLGVVALFATATLAVFGSSRAYAVPMSAWVKAHVSPATTLGLLHEV
jgi:hypothetical protein